LRSVVGIAESFDDSRKEERETVKRGVYSDCDEHVYVDLPVLDSVEEVLGIELISEPTTVLLKTAGHLLFLLRSQELGGARVILHIEESDDSDDEGEDSFEDENPLPMPESVQTENPCSIHTYHPFMPPSPDISLIPRARRPPKAASRIY